MNIKAFPTYKKLFAIFLLLSSSYVSADMIETDDSQIYTDNFTINKSKSANDLMASQSLGSLGQYAVVSGKKSENHIAFVKRNNGNNYIISNKIIVTCSTKNKCILPENLKVEQLSSKHYEVTVSDYDEWSKVVLLLKDIPGVLKVSPSYLYGQKTSLK